jgi:hypothetical protein
MDKTFNLELLQLFGIGLNAILLAILLMLQVLVGEEAAAVVVVVVVRFNLLLIVACGFVAEPPKFKIGIFDEGFVIVAKSVFDCCMLYAICNVVFEN